MLKNYIFKENPIDKQFVDDFLFSKKHKKYIMGFSRDGYARDVTSIVEIEGVIDDFTSEKFIEKNRVFKSEDVQKDSLVLVCSTVRTLTAIEKLKEMGFSRVLDYPSFYMHSKNEKLNLRIFSCFGQEFKANFDRFKAIYNRLEDDTSKDIFSDLVAYRVTANKLYTNKFKFKPEEQYFDDIVRLNEEVFVDVGAYDGQTTLEFIKRCPSYKKVYLLEPEKDNLHKAHSNLEGYRDINLIEFGASDSRDTLRFTSSLGSASSISESGDVIIEVDSLDNLIQDKITFLKMDIEGAEVQAIKGARNHIMNDHPKMAIAVYHKCDDFYKIPELIFSIRNDYKIYIRHYTEGTDETIMYFIPIQY